MDLLLVRFEYVTKHHCSNCLVGFLTWSIFVIKRWYHPQWYCSFCERRKSEEKRCARFIGINVAYLAATSSSNRVPAMPLQLSMYNTRQPIEADATAEDMHNCVFPAPLSPTISKIELDGKPSQKKIDWGRSCFACRYIWWCSRRIRNGNCRRKNRSPWHVETEWSQFCTKFIFSVSRKWGRTERNL